MICLIELFCIVMKISLPSATLATLMWVYLHRGLAFAAGTIRQWHVFLIPFHLQYRLGLGPQAFW
jgi:hypothetical protein